MVAAVQVIRSSPKSVFFFFFFKFRAERDFTGCKRHWGDRSRHHFPGAVLHQAQSVMADVTYLSFYLFWQCPQVRWVLFSTGASEPNFFYHFVHTRHLCEQGDAAEGSSWREHVFSYSLSAMLTALWFVSDECSAGIGFQPLLLSKL